MSDAPSTPTGETVARGPGLRSCRTGESTLRAMRLRQDRDRVSKSELEAALWSAGLAQLGQQSEAARVIGVGEACLRAWRHPRKLACLPTRRAVATLQDYAELVRLQARFARRQA